MTILDANVLLYAYNEADENHRDAQMFLERSLSSDEVVGIPWVAILAFVRIATNPRIYPKPLSVREACEIVDAWTTAPNVETIGPGPNHWKTLRAMLVDGKASGNLATDAHLAALTIENGAILVTADRDFARFPGLKTRFLA